MDPKQVADMFVDAGWLNAEEGHALSQEAATTGKPIENVMVEHGIVTEDQFFALIAESLGTEVVDLDVFDGATHTLHLIPGGLARLHGALPVGHSDNTIFVALVDPLNPQIAEICALPSIARSTWSLHPSAKVRALISQYDGSEVSTMEDVLAQLGENPEVTLDEVTDDQFNAQVVAQEANATPIIRFVDLILYQAIYDRASDIHFEPFETEFKIRYRVDGALYEMAPPPRHLALPVISRVKVMANLNIAERRLPQDGRILRVVNGKRSTCAFPRCRRIWRIGRAARARPLDREPRPRDLGMPDYIYDYILETIEKPNGIFIVTGPTGSGKTTTLYACLRKINTVDSKLLTAEDPVEYDIEGIIQVR